MEPWAQEKKTCHLIAKSPKEFLKRDVEYCIMLVTETKEMIENAILDAIQVAMKQHFQISNHIESDKFQRII